MLGTLGTGAIIVGIPLVLGTAASAWLANRHRTSACVAFVIGAILAMSVIDMVLAILVDSFL